VPPPRAGQTIKDTVVLDTSSYVAGQSQIARGWQGAKDSLGGYLTESEKVNRLSSLMVTGGVALIAATAGIGASFVSAAGDVQAITSAYTTLLGSSDAAKKKIAELQDFAAATPFDFKASAQGGQQLLAMGESAATLIPTMRSVANAVAAAGGDTTKFLSVLRTVGQIRTKGVLQGDELLQFAEAGIPALKILQRELGLTNDQIKDIGSLHLDADKVIPALMRGFDKDYGAALNNAAGNYNTAASTFGDTLEQFKAVAGEALLPDVTNGITQLTKLTEAARDFVKEHPNLVKMSLVIGGLGGVGLMATAGLIKLVQFVKEAAKAKDFLTKATVADTLAEKVKATVAGQEGAAIGGVGKAAGETAAKMGLLARVKGLAGTARGWSAAPAMVGGGALPTISAMGYGGGMVSKGRMALGVGLGVGAGLGTRADLKALGASELKADLIAGITGALTAGVTVFFPPARALVAAAELLRLGVNSFYNEPKEREAAAGTLETTGGEGTEKKIIDTKDRRQKADLYSELSAKAFKSGDTVTGESFAREAISQKKAAKVEDLQHEKDAQEKRLADATANMNTQGAQAKKRDMMEHPERYYNVTGSRLGEDALVTSPGGNAAYEEDGGPLGLAGQRVRAASGRTEMPRMLPMVRNYGNQGEDANNYSHRLSGAEETPNFNRVEAGMSETRDGTTVVRLPARQADHMVKTLKRHNDLRTDLRGQ
jgi:tape measure domain-containing protein